ncbi:MAG TPA: hypothetical protein VFR81_16625 [Longimicrobium sp.]|nr:hypothetical protein [Longimicrobium sp.]
MTYLAVNALALTMGLAIFAFTRSSSGWTPWIHDGVILASGGLLLATALFGVSVEGASRWMRIAGLSLQVSLIVVPAMLVAFSRRRGLVSTLGMILAAVAMAIQPDRAMAGVLAVSLAALAVHRRDRWVLSSLGVSVAAFVATLLRPDSLPALPYVDGILYSAFDVHPVAGLAVVGGALLLVVPAVAGYGLDPRNRGLYAVFGIAWLGMVVAAALGNYPTPLVGYGGSAVLGYALSLAFLPKKARSAAAAGERVASAAAADEERGPDLRINIAYG